MLTNTPEYIRYDAVIEVGDAALEIVVGVGWTSNSLFAVALLRGR